MAFIAVHGIGSDLGFTCSKTDVAALNAIMAEQTRWRTVVGDHSKLLTIATNQISTIESADILLNDFGASDATVALYQERGVEIRRA